MTLQKVSDLLRARELVATVKEALADDATFEAKVRDQALGPLFSSIAELFALAEHALYVDHYVRGRPEKGCKREYLRRFRLTARQFNAIAVDLRGKVDAARAAQKLHIGQLQGAIAAAEKAIRKAERDLAKLGRQVARRNAAGKGSRPDVEAAERKKRQLRFRIHQKRRRLAALRLRLSAVEADRSARRVRLCFGGKRMFRAQFHLRENGFTSLADWQQAYRQARCSQFLCLGSKDETAGNQSCTRLPDGKLRLRIPPALEDQYGIHVEIPGIVFPYGQAVIDAALLRGEAVTYRFLRRQRGLQEHWYVQATVDRPDVAIVTRRATGAIGVDFNPAHMDVAEIDRFGNVVGSRSCVVDLSKRRGAQATAMLSEIVADIVDWARSSGKPIAVEELDFRKKKAALREQSPRYARMLSGFAYGKFHALLRSRAAREGVEIIDEDGDGAPGVNPAFTSVIGEVKFASGYGLSSHCAAAVAIARRGLRFGERLRSRSAFPLPARNRGKHVWADWRRLSQRLRAERARGRRPFEGDSRRGAPLSSAAPAQAPPGQGPPCDGTRRFRGAIPRQASRRQRCSVGAT